MPSSREAHRNAMRDAAKRAPALAGAAAAAGAARAAGTAVAAGAARAFAVGAAAARWKGKVKPGSDWKTQAEDPDPAVGPGRHCVARHAIHILLHHRRFTVRPFATRLTPPAGDVFARVRSQR
jgi:hypothetical protein